MTVPPRWTEDQLNEQLDAAQDIFRQERVQEPLEDYLEAFDTLQGVVEDLLETTIDLSTLNETAMEVLTQPALLEAFDTMKGVVEDLLETTTQRAQSQTAFRSNFPAS